MPEERKRRMSLDEYLLLRGWRRYVIEEIATERRRKMEAYEASWPLADTGVRYVFDPVGMECDLVSALGGQLIREARDVGGFERLVEVLEAARREAGHPRSGGNGDGKRPPGLE